jgi:glycosyltransferase involved in cell wall biosynthesis
MNRLLYPRADAITAVSSEVGEDLVKHTGIPSHSVTTIPNPMPEVPSPSATAPHPWLEEDIPIFLAIASLSKQKDYPTLLRAFEMLLRNQPARLLILGKGREEQALQTLAKELDITEHISFEGYRFDRHDYLSRTDFFVLSSTYEGMPNSLLEAMAHNLPVISTKCPGGPMEALQDGRYGLICDVGSPESMAAAMAQALNNPEKARGQANLERFQADSIFDAYEQALLG